MKLLAACILLSTASLVNAGVVRLESHRRENILDYLGRDMSPIQRKCIRDEIKKFAVQNSELKPWLEDVNKFIDDVEYQYGDCSTLGGDAYVECMWQVLAYSQDVWKLLTDVLEEDEKPAIEKINSIGKHCYEQDDMVNSIFSRFELDREVFTRIGGNGGEMSSAEKKCINNEFIKLNMGYPELKPWLDNVEKYIYVADDKFKLCSSLDGDDYAQCMWEVVAYAKNEWEHLKGELTEEQKQVVEKINFIEEHCQGL